MSHKVIRPVLKCTLTGTWFFLGVQFDFKNSPEFEKYHNERKENTDDDFVIVDRPGKYFIIQQLRCGNSGKVMNASLSKIGEITMSDFNGGENQLWYWDGRHQDILRNKKFPDKVLNILATTVCIF